MTKASTRHSMDGRGMWMIGNAQVAMRIGEIVKHGIPVNALKVTDMNAAGTYVLAAPCKTSDGKNVVALVHIDIRKHTVVAYGVVDIAHSSKGKNIKKKQTETGYSNRAYGLSTSDTPASSEMSVADFLDKVNTFFPSILSDDVQERLHPDEHAEGYYTDNKLFSIKEETGKDPLAEVMRENAELKKLVQELRAKASGLRAEIPKAVVHRYARELKQQYGMSKISIKTIESYLTRAFGLMTSREAGDAAAGMEMLGDIAYTILNRGEALQKTAQERNTAIKAAEREKPCKAREKEKALISQDFLKECRQRDLNPQAFRRRILSPLRMPFRHAGRFRAFCAQQKFRKREKPTRSGAGQYSSGGAIQI